MKCPISQFPSFCRIEMSIESHAGMSQKLSDSATSFSPFPYHPCMVYLPTFSYLFLMVPVNVRKYTIHGCYGLDILQFYNLNLTSFLNTQHFYAKRRGSNHNFKIFVLSSFPTQETGHISPSPSNHLWEGWGGITSKWACEHQQKSGVVLVSHPNNALLRENRWKLLDLHQIWSSRKRVCWKLNGVLFSQKGSR